MELEVSSYKWSTGVCRADSVSVISPGYTGIDLYPYMIPRKYMVTLVEDDGVVRASGMVTLPAGDTDDDGIHHVAWPGQGIESLFERRHVLPAAYWPLVDSQGYPNLLRDTYIEGVDYGTMMKRLYQQSVAHPGGSLPLMWQEDRPGTRQKGWSAVSGTSVQEAVTDIANLLGGVEWDWVPTLDDNDRLSLALITGTDTNPEISYSTRHTWQSGGEEPDISSLKTRTSPEFMTSTAIFMGGKEDDRIVASRAHSLDLIANGIPLTEIWDTSHSSVSVQSTLDGWAGKALDEGSAPIQYWEFNVRADRAHGLRHGDWCTVEVSDHWLIPDGSYSRRVIAISGSSDQSYLGVTVAGELSW